MKKFEYNMIEFSIDDEQLLLRTYTDYSDFLLCIDGYINYLYDFYQ